MPVNYDTVGAEFRVAAINNDVEAMKHILKEHPNLDIDCIDSELQRTALHWAIISGSEAATTFLLEREACVNIVDCNGVSPYDLSLIHPISIENKRTIMIGHMSENFFRLSLSVASQGRIEHTRRNDNSINFLISKMETTLERLKSTLLKKIPPILVGNLSSQQQNCLRKSYKCGLKIAEKDIAPILGEVYTDVKMLENAPKLNYVVNEFLLRMSKNHHLISKKFVSWKEKVMHEMRPFPDVSDLKKQELAKICKMGHLISETFVVMQKDVEKLHAGSCYKNFANMAKKYLDAGNSLAELELMGDCTSVAHLFEQYNIESHLKWYEFLVLELKKNLSLQAEKLDVVLKTVPFALSDQECLVFKESLLQSLTTFLDGNLKKAIYQATSARLQSIMIAKGSEGFQEAFQSVPIASYIFTYVMRIQNAVEEVIARTLNNHGTQLLFVCSQKDTSHSSIPLHVDLEDFQENKQESHAEVVLREKQWRREQEAKIREEQQTRTLLLQQQAYAAKAEEERKQKSAAERAACKQELLRKIVRSSCADTFHAILNEKMNKNIKWEKLVALGEGLGISRMEGGKCIFSLFDLGAVTFHRGHGKDNSDYADPIGINTLRDLFKSLGFDKDTFLQACREVQDTIKMSCKKS